MTIPLTGTTWKAGGFTDVDSRFLSRGPAAALLIRDNRGSATDISPWAAGTPPTVNWSPFAQDGQLRDDLFATVLVDGDWITNPETNEGFWLIGAFEEGGGPERAPNISQDDFMILQSNFPFDSDLTGEGIVINFTGVETLKPLLKRLRMNVRLSDDNGYPLVEDPGTDGFELSKPVDAESYPRQIIVVYRRNITGGPIYVAEGYPYCKLTDIGNYRRSKTDADSAQLSFTVLPDPYHVSKDPSDPFSGELVPALYSEWHSGAGWTGIGGAT